MNARDGMDGGHPLRGDLSTGFTLLEVMVAVILLGVLAVPLVTSSLSALGAANAARLRDGHLAAVAAVSGGKDAWEWGVRVESVVWQSGPTLEVTVGVMGQAEGVAPLVGLWTDGWFLGEQPPEDDGVCNVAASEWRGAAGQELVIRVREPEGPWGPPWRTVVPDWGGEDPALTEIDPMSMSGAGRTDGKETAVHASALANPTVRCGNAGPLVDLDPLGLVLLVKPGGSGRCELSVGPEEAEGSVQSWYEEDARALDVYF